jgi:hypothetical protein
MEAASWAELATWHHADPPLQRTGT